MDTVSFSFFSFTRSTVKLFLKLNDNKWDCRGDVLLHSCTRLLLILFLFPNFSRYIHYYLYFYISFKVSFSWYKLNGTHVEFGSVRSLRSRVLRDRNTHDQRVASSRSDRIGLIHHHLRTRDNRNTASRIDKKFYNSYRFAPSNWSSPVRFWMTYPWLIYGMLRPRSRIDDTIRTNTHSRL